MRQAIVRDIREDLIERLEAANAEMASARTKYDVEKLDLERRFHTLFEDICSRQRALSVLMDEEERAHGPRARPSPTVREMKLPLQDFILNALNSTGSMSKEDVKDLVERAGYVGSNESAGRMVHTTLMNLRNSGKLQMMADGQYEVTHRFVDYLAQPYTKSLISIWASNKQEDPPADEASEP